jgi:hypothetical protein
VPWGDREGADAEEKEEEEEFIEGGTLFAPQAQPTADDLADMFLSTVRQQVDDVNARSVVVYLEHWLSEDTEWAEHGRQQLADAVVQAAQVPLGQIDQVDMVAKRAMRTGYTVRAQTVHDSVRFLLIVMRQGHQAARVIRAAKDA